MILELWFMILESSFLTHDSWLLTQDLLFLTHDSWFWPLLKEAHKTTHSNWLSFELWGEDEDPKLSAPIPALLTRQVKTRKNIGGLVEFHFQQVWAWQTFHLKLANVLWATTVPGKAKSDLRPLELCGLLVHECMVPFAALDLHR